MHTRRQPFFTKLSVIVMTKLSSLVHTSPMNSLWTERQVCSANGIQEVAANNPLETISTNFSAVERKLSKRRVTGYATSSPAIYSAASGSMVTGICESLDLMLEQTTAATIQQPQRNVTNLSFAATDEEIIYFTSSSPRTLLLQPVKTKRGLAPRQQHVQISKLEHMAALRQDWQSMVELSPVEDKLLKKGFIELFSKNKDF